MNCNEIQTLLSMMLDEELPDKDRASVMDHIASCPDCRKVYDAFSVLSDSLKDLADVPVCFTESVMQKLPVRKRNSGRRRWLSGMAAMAACLALILFAGRSLILPAAKGDNSNDAAPMMADTNSSNTRNGTNNSETYLMSFDNATIYQNNLSSPEAVGFGAVEEYTDGAMSEAQEALDPDLPSATYKSTQSAVSNTLSPTSLDTILTVSAPADYGSHEDIADYTVVFSNDENTYILNIWVEGDRLYCQDDVTSNAYYAAGNYAQLLALIDE